MHAPSRKRLLLTIAALLGGMVLSGVVAYHVAERRTLRDEAADVRRQLGLYAQALQQRVDRYRTLPQVLALDPELRAAVTGTMDAAALRALDRKLELANGITHASTLTLIDRRGIALAASNWRRPDSNVGVDFSFRPYVQQALATGSGRFYGIGMTTGEAGYYLSQGIRDDGGRVVGLVVIKIALSALEEEWVRGPDIVLASDARGVVFLAARDAWRYRLLSPLSQTDLRELSATRQYLDQPLRPLRRRVQLTVDGGGEVVRVVDPALPRHVLWQTLALGESDWRLHLLHDTRGATAAARTAAFAAGGASLALGLLLMFVQQRRRLESLRRRSREELETVLRQHAQELRTAQDGLLDAAQRADTGLARSLEHLPQGVVVINSDLRIAAWNSRYLEIFRFPADLVRVGRPIEEIFRHNARRGLLGPGPVEDAIQRRLDHLRSGKPHIRESEKEDGTVLEIRGNPLPDGGFVTSYADITTYRHAARELRSLADALETRVEERTRALAAATQAAEDANRYKTRFVASAVHDLLQPLNAARMFVSTLAGRLPDDDARRIAGHADDALAAQDAILNSLLDIARLESGVLPTQVRDVALDPLLDALARDFGILAEGRGLALDRVPTSAIVHSDAALLRRILQNLLSNAIRYTPRGRVLLGVRRTGAGVRVEVHDQGPGIPASLQREIFEEFRRLDDGVASDRGAGLGLAIVERIGRLLGHRIGLRSRLGRGSVFWVELPFGGALVPTQALVPAASTVDAMDDDSPLRGCRAWCVDDDAGSREGLCALLQRWECAVANADGVDAAIDAARDDNAPQLLLIAQPDVASALALRARLAARWGAAPPTILLVDVPPSAGARARAAREGCGVLSMPLRPPALRSLVAQLLLRHSAQTLPPARAAD